MRRGEPVAIGDFVWHDVREWGVEGKGWPDTEEFFDRLPARAKGVVRPPVWDLSRHSAGLCVWFETDATAIAARWTLLSETLAMAHMSATAVSGLDLYARSGGDPTRLQWVGSGSPNAAPDVEIVLANGLDPGRRSYCLYLPLYNGVRRVDIGIAHGALFQPIAPRAARPLVFYGTSIVQGGCASRPGMAHTAILGRRLDCPVINLGFSGNGHMDIEIADLLSELNPWAYVVDCLPNISAELVAQRTEPFVQALRRTRPDTPVVLVEDPTKGSAPLKASHRKNHAEKRAALAGAFARLRAAGDRNLYYVTGERLLGNDGEATVDGSHPTDLGFVRMADALEPVLRSITMRSVSSRSSIENR